MNINKRRTDKMHLFFSIHNNEYIYKMIYADEYVYMIHSMQSCIEYSLSPDQNNCLFEIITPRNSIHYTPHNMLKSRKKKNNKESGTIYTSSSSSMFHRFQIQVKWLLQTNRESRPILVKTIETINDSQSLLQHSIIFFFCFIFFQHTCLFFRSIL